MRLVRERIKIKGQAERCPTCPSFALTWLRAKKHAKNKFSTLVVTDTHRRGVFLDEIPEPENRFFDCFFNGLQRAAFLATDHHCHRDSDEHGCAMPLSKRRDLLSLGRIAPR